MKDTIPLIYNGDSYLFRLADDSSVASIEFYANNKNVIPKPRKWSELDPELHRLFNRQLARRRRKERSA